MRVMCINASPLEGHSNIDLHLLKEGRVYDVIAIHEDGDGYNIGVRPKYCVINDIPCYWGMGRFIECQEDPLGEELKVNIKGKVNGNKRSNPEEAEGSDSGKPI